MRESPQFAQTVENNLNAFRNGKSWQSTTGGSDSQSQEQSGQPLSKMDQLKKKLSDVNKQNQEKKDLNSSLNGNKMSAFESKMAKFNQA